MSWLSRTVNRIGSSVNKFVHDPKRMALAVGTAGMSEQVRAAKNALSPSLPGVNVDQNARNQVSGLLADQMKTAQEFEKGLPGYIEGEYGDRARVIKQQSKDAMGGLRSNLNARGMLHSGLEQSKENRLNSETAGALTSARGDVVRDALQRATAMKTDPALSAEANTYQQQSQLANIDAVKAQRDAFRNQMLGQGLGTVGYGVGTGLADSSKFKRT